MALIKPQAEVAVADQVIPGPVVLARRNLTVRIEGIPLDHIDTLEDNIRSIVNSDLHDTIATLRRRSLVRGHQPDRMATATVTVETAILGDELCRQLGEARGSSRYPYTYSSRFEGITPMYEGEGNAVVDVVAVPGLASHAFGSWKSQNNDDIWLCDYLPKDIPEIRVLLYGYDTRLQNNLSKQSIEDLGVDFLESLVAFRAHDGTCRRPIIFIGHSLGGLLIKEALVHSLKQTGDPEKVNMSQSCYGMLFFGVPNFGLRNEQLIAIVQGQPNEALIRQLVVDSDMEPSAFLRRISEEFCRTCEGQYKVVSFFERRSSPVVEVLDGKLRKTGNLCLLVTKESATSMGRAASDQDNIPLDTDHSELVKYSSRSQAPYTIVRRRLGNLIAGAQENVPKRFAAGCM
ncbi:Vegetative incompatibility protein HET-E-1 [Pleurostoma richardsiae]|uniref:Vegetative incompatibility protein HET-E-1 n=1 Tax=Pleurostoma richardsiae TaxID=41990 RepID=A0AA38RE62_9PEZI|nr:Vegetative incompatibility protein HET-E-1 [Pleurostoma richardsiae]